MPVKKIKINDNNFYCSHKYIKDLSGGGAQDNQYTDIKIFLSNCKRVNTDNDYFIAICDGAYFTDVKMKYMNENYGYRLYYSQHHYQKLKSGINTCGRWCGLFM